MKSSPKPEPGLLRLILLTFFRVLPGFLLFEICFKGLASLVFKPILAYVTKTLLAMGGQQLMFNEDILSMFSSLTGIAAALLLATLAAFLAYYEFSVLFLLAENRMSGRHLRLSGVLMLAFATFPSMKSWQSVGFAVYALGLMPLMGMGLSPALLPELRIPNFITGELSKTIWGSALVVLFYTAMALLFAILMFTVPAMVLGRKRFFRAARGSLETVRMMGWRPWLVLGPLYVLNLALFRWPGLVPTQFAGITGAGLRDLVINLLGGRLLPSLPAFILSGLLRIALTGLFVAVITVLYARLGGRAAIDRSRLPAIFARVDKTSDAALRAASWAKRGWRALLEKIRATRFYQRHYKLCWLALGAVLTLAFTAVFAQPPVLHAPIAVGHRGSLEGVENTIQAVQGAIDAGADYAEIDILLSKDAVPMVIHDSSLSRLAGVGKSVYEMTAAELTALPLSQNGFTGTISTLDEMIRFAKGKIRLLVELKAHGRETEDIALQVVKVVEQGGFEDQCLFMSLDYNLVQRLHELRPEWAVGYCVYGNVGSVNASALFDLGVDFLTIEESMVSPRFVYRCLRAGLPVYVWTVDARESMDLYLQAGVSGIISDYPDWAHEAVKGYSGGNAEQFYYWQNNLEN